jgi:hypothetical protein
VMSYNVDCTLAEHRGEGTMGRIICIRDVHLE